MQTETTEVDQTSPKSAIALPEDVSTSTEIRRFTEGLYDPNMDFRKLAMEATYFTKGFRLVEDKDTLAGVPHVITNLTFREGYSTTAGPGDYVSIEAVVADRDTLNSNPVRHYLPAPSVDQLAVYPNEAIVYNDGGTGIRRACVKMLHDIGLIDVGAPEGDENPFDRPYQLWAEGAEQAAIGFTADKNGQPLRYVVIRGLRRSDYTSPYGEATTFYFA